ncbi:MAG: sigma-54 dependent transcriptional regulator [bacterium]
MSKILVVDDELSMREFLEILLQKEGYEVESAASGEEALQRIKKDRFDLIICDIMMPRVSGMEVLKRARELYQNAMVIMITAYASPENAVEAMKIGAYDYITKPFQVDEILLVVGKALEKTRLVEENLRLRQEVESRYTFRNLVGASRPMQEVYDLIRKIAPTKANVLILGESGTGKELAAKAIHYNSTRADKPMVTVNCGAIPAELLESELFGHLKGSFTGAYQDKKGLFEVAHQGTVFLDEVGETPLNIQVKLLRAIQEKTFKPVGGVKDVSVDVRVIAASNRDLQESVKNGDFREDLYYRLNVIQMTMPPLRERKDDIPLLVEHFINRFADEIGKEVSGISDKALATLQEYEWPGNIRELENTIERAISLAYSDTIMPDNLPDNLSPRKTEPTPASGTSIPPEGMELEKYIEEVERNLIEEALQRTGGVKKRAAELLGISFRSFRYRLEKLGIEREDEMENEA